MKRKNVGGGSATATERERRLRDQLFRRTVATARRTAFDRRSDTLRAQGERTTEMLSTLVNRMGQQVEQSEQTTSSLIHSSSVLRESHSNFTSIKNAIRSGGKLISKYGRRETTDKILIVLCLLLYFGVCFYILRKRMRLLKVFDWWYWFE
ncbi:hypothetical protein niasHS_011192 [Heterodera schachtii]|uniref:Sec20 C-terminal domain-containing protein n=1 Tax=Heterodera schachtii TaxID=97005 RepID=A0ABD2IZU6_HETSC